MTNVGFNIWRVLEDPSWSEVTALLRVMVLKGAPPPWLVAQLRPEYKRVVEE
jgi:hypothetical protein